ncbi:hypothetical protein [Cohnella yongneupensis]|uniref:Uncharacterized protein n=1 Tax=Cohnella yongneupensis TaxID=425006 RepID=A0ABW0QZP6_9BACL
MSDTINKQLLLAELNRELELNRLVHNYGRVIYIQGLISKIESGHFDEVEVQMSDKRPFQWHPYSMLLKNVLDEFGGLKGMNAKSLGRTPGHRLAIRLNNGKEIFANPGDWIIKGDSGIEIIPREASE